uniref:Uncharacterized protein n=1 Tax=Ditylenchus dipsaci TaxID=166011 RepID=A0A915E7J3_9BILA
MSHYEDALDESDFELRQLCTDAAKHINKRVALEQKQQHKRPQKRVSSQQELPNSAKSLSSPSTNTGAVPTQCCTSSDGSSIEKIGGMEVSSTNSGGKARRKASRLENINYEEEEGQQPADCHPILLQLHRQLKLLSGQLYEMETTNVLQLKLIYRTLRMVFKLKLKEKTGEQLYCPNGLA